MNALEKAYANRSKKINKVENLKALKDPMKVYEHLEEISAGGYETLSKEDASYFLKCFGLFDKGEDFMLRVRIPGGQMSAAQARRIGELAREYGKDYIDLTTRMQVELRYLQIGDIAKVIHALREVGISTFQTGVDNPRNIVTDPLDGLAHDNILPAMPLIERLQEVFLEKPEWISALPRKFNTGVLGSLSNSCNIFGHDCCFVLAQREGIWGYNVYLGARVGVQARDADCFVTEEEAPRFYRALLETFKRYGYRDNRNKNRLHFLLSDVGVSAFVDAVKAEANETFAPAGVTMVQSIPVAMGSDRILLRDGTFAYKMIVPSGIFSGSDIIEAAVLAEKHGSGALRIGYDQNLHFVDIPSGSMAAFEAEALVSKYARYHNPYFADMIACAGTQTCSYGVIPNKPDAIEMADFLNREVPIERAVVRMNWSACPKGCGIHGIADIGFEGCKAKDSEGNRVDGVHLYLGGKITREGREARTLHKTLPITEAKYHVKHLLRLYRDHRRPRESFEDFEERFLSSHYSYQAVAFFTKINYILNDRLDLESYFDLEEAPKSGRREDYEIFTFGLRLYRQLTGEKRFEAVDGLKPTLARPRSIKRDTVSRLNPKVPPKLSEVLYLMTHEKQTERAQVFSELLVMLKEI
ncbi:nitrite/sulfite reductase [Nitratifractor sp.]